MWFILKKGENKIFTWEKKLISQENPMNENALLFKQSEIVLHACICNNSVQIFKLNKSQASY